MPLTQCIHFTNSIKVNVKGQDERKLINISGSRGATCSSECSSSYMYIHDFTSRNEKNLKRFLCNTTWAWAKVGETEMLTESSLCKRNIYNNKLISIPYLCVLTFLLVLHTCPEPFLPPLGPEPLQEENWRLPSKEQILRWVLASTEIVKMQPWLIFVSFQ